MESVRRLADQLLRKQHVHPSNYTVCFVQTSRGTYLFEYHLKRKNHPGPATWEYKVYVDPRTRAATFTKGAFVGT